MGKVLHEAVGKSNVTLAQACSAGDLLGYSTGWKKSNATGGAIIKARLIAAQDGAIGDVINAYTAAMVEESGGTYTPQAILYASKTAGGVTETAPAGATDWNETVGMVISATRYWIDLMAAASLDAKAHG